MAEKTPGELVREARERVEQKAQDARARGVNDAPFANAANALVRLQMAADAGSLDAEAARLEVAKIEGV